LFGSQANAIRIFPAFLPQQTESYSVLAYEKGFTLLLYLERLVGTPKFEAFFQAYVARFAYQTLTSQDFKDFFLQHFQGNDKIKEIDWDKWFHSTGMPPVLPPLDQSMAQDSTDLANLWLTIDHDGKSPPSKNDMASWSSSQITCFLDALLIGMGDQPLQLSTLQSMNTLYGLAESRNSEILFRYCDLAIASKDPSILPVAVRFITTQGRMKFVRPLYKALYRSEMGKDLAVSTFLKHQDFYHPIATKMIATDLSVGRMKKNVIANPWILGGIAVAVAGIGLSLLRGRRK
jgi:leukotriene-A4 hydrolase